VQGDGLESGVFPGLLGVPADGGGVEGLVSGAEGEALSAGSLLEAVVDEGGAEG
jgi:hypothetical protein